MHFQRLTHQFWCDHMVKHHVNHHGDCHHQEDIHQFREPERRWVLQYRTDDETNPADPCTDIGYETTQACDDRQNEEVRQTKNAEGDNVNNDRNCHNGVFTTDKGIENLVDLQSDPAEIFFEAFNADVK